MLRPKILFIHIQQNYDTMSGFGVVQRRSHSWGRHRHVLDVSEFSIAESYCSRHYYSSIGIHGWEVHFTIVWNLKSLIAVSIQNVPIML